MVPFIIPVVSGLMKNWKLFLGAAVALGIITTIGLAYWHYTGLLNDVAELQTSTATLTLEKEIQAGHIAQMGEGLQKFKENEERVQKKLNELARHASAARQETRRLHALFSRHDFEKLAVSKPGLIEKRVNTGTLNLLGVLGCESGRAADCKHTKTQH